MTVATADVEDVPTSDVAMRVSGPAALNVIAGLKGSEAMARVDFRPSESQFVLEAGGRALSFLDTPSRSERLTVLYIISGPRSVVEKQDSAFRQVWTLLGSEGPSVVSKFVATFRQRTGRGRRTARSKGEGVSQTEKIAPSEPTAVENWAILKAELLQENRFETGPKLGRILGSRAKNPSEFVSRLRREGKIFAVESGGRDLFPLFQFRENKPNPAVAAVLEALTPKLSNWAILSWFCTPDEWSCAGKMPKDLLETDPDAVVKAAHHLVAPSWD